LRKLLPANLRTFLSRLLATPERLDTADLALDLLTRSLLRQRYSGMNPVSSGLEGHELRVRSQNGEDGILLWLFSRIGTADRELVEIGCGDGRECNGANLVLSWAWRGVFVDADREKLHAARGFFDRTLGPRASTVTCVHARVRTDNMDGIVTAQTSEHGPDLLSIDVDGNDYWLWQALTARRPSVVVVEYNAAFGSERSVTVPYDPAFDRLTAHRSGLYHGASLRALAALGRRKGYLLVGCESEGVNAFFVRRDLAGDLPEVAPDVAFRPLSVRHAPWDPEEQRALIAGLPLVEV
jgi:hypothetical protein